MEFAKLHILAPNGPINMEIHIEEKLDSSEVHCSCHNDFKLVEVKQWRRSWLNNVDSAGKEQSTHKLMLTLQQAA